MDAAEFQKKLTELCERAEQNDRKLAADQIRACFAEMELDVSQLLRVVQYLKGKGIEIVGVSLPAASVEEDTTERSSGTPAELSTEDRAYLEEYLSAYDEAVYGEEAWSELLERWIAGDAMAKADLYQYYLPKAARMAAEQNCEEIALADLIQEANIGLLMALDRVNVEEESENPEDSWIRARIQTSIREAIMEQCERVMQDNALISHVEKLEQAVKDLTDEEDGEMKFSVDELAVILDMEVDEIRDILRLTGDDK